MKTGVSIVAGLLAGILVAAGILAALVLVGPDPVGLRPTPAPTVVATALPSPSASLAIPSPSGSAGPSEPAPSGSATASIDPGAAFHIGQPAPPLSVLQVGGGQIDLATRRGKAIWLNFMQTTCPECIDEFPLMNGFSARHAANNLVAIAVDIREDEGPVATSASRLKATFPLGLDTDGKAQQAWGTYALPIHFWIDKDGIVRAGRLGGVGSDAVAAALAKFLPRVNVTP